MENLDWTDPADTASDQVLAVMHREGISQNKAIIEFLVSDSAIVRGCTDF